MVAQRFPGTLTSMTPMPRVASPPNLLDYRCNIIPGGKYAKQTQDPFQGSLSTDLSVVFSLKTPDPFGDGSQRIRPLEHISKQIPCLPVPDRVSSPQCGHKHKLLAFFSHPGSLWKKTSRVARLYCRVRLKAGETRRLFFRSSLSLHLKHFVYLSRRSAHICSSLASTPHPPPSFSSSPLFIGSTMNITYPAVYHQNHVRVAYDLVVAQPASLADSIPRSVLSRAVHGEATGHVTSSRFSSGSVPNAPYSGPADA